MLTIISLLKEFSNKFIEAQLNNQQIKTFDLRVTGCNAEFLEMVEKQLITNRKRIEHTLAIQAGKWRQGVIQRRRRT